MAMNQGGLDPIFSFRSDMGYTDLEKRRLFLKSYQFSRKKSVSERIKRSYFRVKRVVWVRLKSAKKFPKMMWSRIKHGFFLTPTRRSRRSSLLRVPCHYNHNSYYAHDHGSNGISSCFW